MPADGELSRGRRRSGVTLIAIAGAILVASSIAKFIGVPMIVDQLTNFGFGGKIRLVGLLEIASGVTLLVPRTRSLGVLLISGFMGGAIATHLQHGELPIPATIILALAWTGVALRHPIAFWSFGHDPLAVHVRAQHHARRTA